MLRGDRFHFPVVGFAVILTLIAWACTPNQPTALEAVGCADDGDADQAYEVTDDTGWTRTLRVTPDCEPGKSNGTASAEADQARQRPLTPTEADLLAQERVAYWTQWIGAFTIIGISAIFGTLVESVRVGKAVNRQLIADHPPRLRVLHIEAQWKNSDRIVGSAIIINEGQADATLRQAPPMSDVSFWGGVPPSIARWREIRQSLGFMKVGNARTIHRTIPAGGVIAWEFETTGHDGGDEFLSWTRKDSKQAGLNLFMIGRVNYLDPNGAAHVTWFCRHRNPETDRWEEVEDSDYEFRT